MTADDRCPITDLIRDQCAHCRKQDLPKPPPLDWFPARYPGSCVECGARFKEDEHIARTDDGYVCRRRHE